MAGHSHWAGIKHKKGRADKQRSKIFSKISKEITVAAKLGDKNPDMNPRLRSAIQSARSANMPKENIERAIDKSTNINSSNFQSMRYEGFGPKNIAVIVEALTDNKNRTASKIRTIFQKNGGSLGSSGSASHNFKQIGVIKIPKNEISEEKILDVAIDSGAEECHSDNEIHEIHCEKNKIYEVKKKLEMTVKNFISTEIEWIPINNVIISKDIFDEISDFLDSLDNDDDVQNIFTNLKIGSN
ncbi:YebC/PmpR family DNA-binding transcriptional regulator [Candidatus Pelagibacter communis]|uniref:YebC/PmpR family DNA-binding transcriptional regulator n=1 Tax=Pelagibacter ubique TaxID=198252 RepID=UPI00094CAE3D|nr:YebC/PmpR family DNA-binding transcriptional regulator [Candidatus Pelagibacter ubique]